MLHRRFCEPAVANFSKGHRNLPRGEFKHKACSELAQSTAMLLFHHVQAKKREHLKTLSLEWKGGCQED